MERWRRGAWRGLAGVAVTAVLAVGMVACGGSDEPESSGDATEAMNGGEPPAGGTTAAGTSTAEPSAPPAREQASATPTQEPTPLPGTDADYLRALCVAMDRFFADVESATHRITPDDPAGIAEEFAEAFGPPLERFAEDMSDASPPADAREWHEKTSGELRNIAEAIQDGNALGEIGRLGDQPLPNPPAGIAERLAVAAGEVAECARFVDVFR